jgi:hypothetical protein
MPFCLKVHVCVIGLAQSAELFAQAVGLAQRPADNWVRPLGSPTSSAFGF